MARGAPVWYVVASLLTALAVYEIFQYTGYDKTLGTLFTALVYIFTFPVGIAFWVYQDAREHGWNGLSWALISIFLPLGFMVYAIAGNRIAGLTGFTGSPELFPLSGLPSELG